MNKVYTYSFDESFVYENTEGELENFISYDALRSFDPLKVETYKYEEEKRKQLNRIFEYVKNNFPEKFL